MSSPVTDRTPPERPGRVLLVEPSEGGRARFRDELTAAHLEVHEAVDLAVAEQALATVQPDVILAQLRLAAESGLELVRRLKEDRGAWSTPVILYSGAATAEERIGAFDLGAADLLSPPLSGGELIARVRAALRDRHILAGLERRAYRDALTGLLNRAALEDQLRREWDLCRRQGTALSVLIVDMDHLKEINDTHGHAIGDDALRRVAETLACSVRSSDLAARYGGDEFVVVAPGCPPASAALLSARFQAGLAGAPILVPGTAAPVAVTASVGIAGAADATDGGPKELLCRADQALYQAKRSGRDAIAIHEPAGNGSRVVVVARATPPGRS